MPSHYNFCPRYALLLKAQDADKNRMLLIRSRCKSWKCNYCARQNTIRLRRHNLDAISSRAAWHWYFCTLTAKGGSSRNAKTSFIALKTALPKMLKELRNEINRTARAVKPRNYENKPVEGERRLLWHGGGLTGLEYFAIFERHQNGVFHQHLFIGLEYDAVIERERKKQSKRTDLDLYLQFLAVRFGLGFKTHAEKINTLSLNAVIKYVTKSTKYLMKDAIYTTGAIPAKSRLIQQSRLFSGQEDIESDKEWIVTKRLELDDIRNTEWYDVNYSSEIKPTYFEFGLYPPLSEQDIEPPADDTLEPF
jgi:hypothetical protein